MRRTPPSFAGRRKGGAADLISSIAQLEQSTAVKAGGVVLLAYLFLSFSRVSEVSVPYLHLPAITLVVAAVCAVIAGGLKRALSHRIGLFLLLFLLWLVAATPFSMWRGGSVGFVIASLKTIPVYALVAGLVVSFAHFRRTVHTLAYAVLVLAFLALALGSTATGRLSLGVGRFDNPNDLAQILIICAPFWWFMAANPEAAGFRRVTGVLGLLMVLFVMLQTGSRGGIITLAATAVLLFFSVSRAKRLGLIFGAAALGILALSLMSDTIRFRYSTFFDVAEEDISDAETARLAGQATGSSATRVVLLKRSLFLTAVHPLFGVGPGMFQLAERELAEAAGERARWHDTHNTFTQVSSEAGIPALLFFAAALVLSFKISHSLRKRLAPAARPQFREIAAAAAALRLSLAAYTVSSLFSSIAYTSDVLPALCGLAVALERITAAELARIQVSTARTQRPTVPVAPELTPKHAEPRR